MNFVYILKSLKTNTFYIGETYDIDQRLLYHNDPILNQNSTKKGIPWEQFLILKVENRAIARRIEEHIKRMKSRKYIENLKQYPEMQTKLISSISNIK
jgi:putative endonuclease